MSSTPKENRHANNLVERSLFKDFPVSKLKFSTTGQLVAASSSHDTSITVYRVGEDVTKESGLDKLAELKVA